MTAKILTITNQKGGSGKTNVAMTLAGIFGARGFNVAVIDGDAQGTASSWHAIASKSGKPFPARMTNLASARQHFGTQVQGFVSEHDIIVIDTPGTFESPVVVQSLVMADVALVPLILAAGDLWATTPLLEMIAQVRLSNKGLKVRIVPNMVQSTSVAEAAVETLSELKLEVTAAWFGARTAYRQAIGLGCTVLDLKDQKAKDEANQLATEALELLGLPKMKKKLTIKRA